MKKIKEIICIVSAAAALVSCSDKSNVSESSTVTEEPAAAVTEQATEPETTVPAETAPPPKKVETADYYGKWVPVRIIDSEDSYELYYNEVPLDHVYQLEISEDGTASMGSGFPDSEPQPYNWEFKGRIIKLSGENELYGGIKEDHLILTNAEGLKVYMERTDRFPSMDENTYEALIDVSGGEIELPELFISENETVPEDYFGKWECSSYEVDGEVFKDDLYGIPLEAIFQMEIMDDNTAVFNVGGSDEDAVVTEYTWEIDEGGCMELYEDGELVSVAQLKNGELCLDEGADITHFRPVDEFTVFDWSTLETE